MLFTKNKNSQKELEYLENEVLEKRKYFDSLNNDINSLLTKKSQLQREYDKLMNEYSKLKTEYDNMYKDVKKFTIEYVDTLSGLDFEQYIVDLLTNIGYINVEKTKASNDYGVDVIAEKDNIKYAIQCKNYNSPLGNTCVQEVYSGKNYYNCHVAVVVTNSIFTKNAIELAKKDGVLLWDRNQLLLFLKQYAENNKKIVILDENKENKKENISEHQEEYDDPLFNEVVEFAIEFGKISATLIQRKYRIGYNRAAKIVDLLEERGIIGPQIGSKPREVLIKRN